MNTIKKITLTTFAAGALLITGLQGADAQSHGKRQMDCWNCPKQNYQLDDETLKKRNKFLDGTVELRKNMAEKRAEMRAVMKSTAPDSKRASQLAGELFTLREQLRTKAGENGLQGHALMGMMGPRGPRSDCGPQRGRGPM